MKTLKKISTVLFWIILFVIALYSIIVISEKLIWKDKTPTIFGYKNFIVISGSMTPSLNIGDIVFVTFTNDIKENDIITFRVNNGVVTHRVVEILEENGEKRYKTKGDANNTSDTELLKIEDIEGKYRFKIGYVGNIILFLQSKNGIALLVTILAISLILNNGKEEKNKKSKEV